MTQINQSTMPTVVPLTGPQELRVVEEQRPPFMRAKDVMHALRCSRGHVRNLVTAGKLVQYELDGLRLFKADEFDRYVSSATPVPVEKSK